MKAGRAQIGIFQKMRIKNLRGVSDVRFRKNSAIFCSTGVWGLIGVKLVLRENKIIFILS